MQDKVLNWFATGRVGISSKAMACAVAGLPQDRTFHNTPCDPDDFNRCLLFLEAVPEARGMMDKIADISPKWRTLVDRWGEVEQSFLDEVGLNWTKAKSAKRTYRLMKEIGL